MTQLLELLFQNTLNSVNFFQKYDDEGYPIDDENEYDDIEDEEELEDDDGFDSEDEESKEELD